MEVSRSNYLTILPEVCEKLKLAEFVSFDAEYTGLKGADGETTSLFDNTAQRYEVLRRVILNNSAPQFGLSIFRRVPEATEEQLYTVDAYSFYVSEPCFANFNMTATKISVEIDCNQFLTSINFDFNKWLNHSVPYLNKVKVKELEKYLRENPDIMEKCRKQERPLDETYFPEYTPKLTESQIEEITRKMRGFSVIADAISERQIPVVGHNMVMDLMYFYHQFCYDLPVNYKDFKAKVVKVLPKIYDTKFMTVKSRKMLDHPSLKHLKLDIEKLKCSGLFVIYKTSSDIQDKFTPKFLLSENCQSFQRDLDLGKTADLEELDTPTFCHDPSFDACVTGIVFLNLVHMACRMSPEFLNRTEPPTTTEAMFFVLHWESQLFVARGTVTTMCLKGDDPRPNRAWVKVTSKDSACVDGLKIINSLKLDPDIQNQLSGVDYQQVSSKEVMLAVSRIQCARELCSSLTKMGYQASKIFIPWDKKRQESSKNFRLDNTFDSRRNKLFC